MLTQQRLKAVLDYDPVAGVFVWRVGHARVKAGARAGVVTHGYRRIMVDGQRYYAHRLAWLYMTGQWPSALIDHRMVGLDNSWTQIRAADKSLNAANSKRRKDNTSGYKGVSWNRQVGKWRAKINVNGKQIHLGTFACPLAAHRAYVAAAKKHFGAYARAA